MEDSKVTNRAKYVELYKSRIPFMEELDIEYTLDLDAGGMRLKDETGRERLVTFGEMTQDIDGAIADFSKAVGFPDDFILDITIRRRNEITYHAKSKVKSFTTDIHRNQGMNRNTLTWVEEDDD